MIARRARYHAGESEAVVEDYPLRRVALERAELERRLADEVSEARARGVSWDRIGHLLDMPLESVRETYGGMRRAS